MVKFSWKKNCIEFSVCTKLKKKKYIKELFEIKKVLVFHDFLNLNCRTGDVNTFLNMYAMT